MNELESAIQPADQSQFDLFESGGAQLGTDPNNLDIANMYAADAQANQGNAQWYDLENNPHHSAAAEIAKLRGNLQILADSSWKVDAPFAESSNDSNTVADTWWDLVSTSYDEKSPISSKAPRILNSFEEYRGLPSIQQNPITIYAVETTNEQAFQPNNNPRPQHLPLDDAQTALGVTSEQEDIERRFHALLRSAQSSEQDAALHALQHRHHPASTKVSF